VPTALASFFGTVDYNYDQRYYAKFILRSDGTSIFGENNRWGYFPSGAVSWRISRENFFKSNSSMTCGYGTRMVLPVITALMVIPFKGQ
jgi:hypothetical protein